MLQMPRRAHREANIGKVRSIFTKGQTAQREGSAASSTPRVLAGFLDGVRLKGLVARRHLRPQPLTLTEAETEEKEEEEEVKEEAETKEEAHATAEEKAHTEADQEDAVKKTRA